MRGHSICRVQVGVAIAAAITVAGVLAGCTTSDRPAPSETDTPSAASSADSTATPAAPLALNPDGDAAENLAYFVSVSEAVLAQNPDAAGRDFIDQLTAVGFDKSQMQVTPDTTAVGLEADNIQFSVNMNGSCLVGQSGNVGFHAFSAPQMSAGNCLIGNTRVIDW